MFCIVCPATGKFLSNVEGETQFFSRQMDLFDTRWDALVYIHREQAYLMELIDGCKQREESADTYKERYERMADCQVKRIDFV